jgi:hypothetical protein
MQIKSGKFTLNNREFTAHRISECPEIALMQVSEIISAVGAEQSDFSHFVRVLFDEGVVIAQRIVDLSESNDQNRIETLITTGAALRFWQMQWDDGNRCSFLCTLMDAFRALEV